MNDTPFEYFFFVIFFFLNLRIQFPISDISKEQTAHEDKRNHDYIQQSEHFIQRGRFSHTDNHENLKQVKWEKRAF